jgi:hypothetical protein
MDLEARRKFIEEFSRVSDSYRDWAWRMFFTQVYHLGEAGLDGIQCEWIEGGKHLCGSIMNMRLQPTDPTKLNIMFYWMAQTIGSGYRWKMLTTKDHQVSLTNLELQVVETDIIFAGLTILDSYALHFGEDRLSLSEID